MTSRGRYSRRGILQLAVNALYFVSVILFPSFAVSIFLFGLGRGVNIVEQASRPMGLSSCMGTWSGSLQTCFNLLRVGECLDLVSQIFADQRLQLGRVVN
jgi:hypothetical protein